MTKPPRAIVLLTNPMTFDVRPLMTANSLSKNGFDVTALCWDREAKNLAVEQISSNLRIERFGLKSTYNHDILKVFGFVLFYVWCTFKSLAIDTKLVYCNDIDTLPLGILIKKMKFSGIKIIFDLHDHPHIFLYNLPFAGFIENFAFNLLRRYADFLIVVNEAFTTYLSSIGFNPAKTTCIMNVSRIQPSRLVRTISNQLTFFYYGSITKERGVDILCEIMGSLPGITLILAGRGDLEEQIKAVLQTHKNILFLGWISPSEIERITNQQVDVIAILTDRFYVRSPVTHTLSSPRKLFTGMAKGIPVVVSEGGFMSKLVEKYGCGIVLDFKDIGKCRKDIEHLRDTPCLVAELGENGFKAALSDFNWEKMEDRLKELCSKAKCYC